MRVLQVEVKGVEGELRKLAEDAITIRWALCMPLQLTGLLAAALRGPYQQGTMYAVLVACPGVRPLQGSCSSIILQALQGLPVSDTPVSCMMRPEPNHLIGLTSSTLLISVLGRPNFAYTAKEVEDNVRHVFQIGYFQQLIPKAEDTRDGVKLTLEVHAHARKRTPRCSRVMC